MRVPDKPGTSLAASALACTVTAFGLLAWLFPFLGSRTIGNDYTRFAIDDQLQLMWSVRNGTFPLYLPGFALGHSSAAATLGQLYHPISWLASALPGYWNGLALEWNTLLRLVSLAVAQLALFRLARRLRVSLLPAFLSSLAAVYNLRMLDSFRYGSALEGYVGMLLVSGSAGFVLLADRARWPVAALGASVWLLLVSGHPQWTYLGLLGAGLFCVLLPWIASAVDSLRARPDAATLRRYAVRLAAGVAGGALLAAPYLLTFYFECYRNNVARVGRAYEWTLEFAGSAPCAACNFTFPLHADVHGAFGGSALFLLAAAFPIAAVFRRGAPLVLWLVYAAGVLAFLFALGSATPVHSLLVSAVPLLGSFRVPGRMAQVIPLLCYPLWLWLAGAAGRWALMRAAAAALLFHAWSWIVGLPALAPGSTAPAAILAGELPSFVEPLVFHLSGATLLALAVVAVFARGRHVAAAVATVAVLATSWFCLQYGTWRTERRPSPTFQALSARRAKLRAPLDSGAGMETRGVAAYRRLGLNPRRPFASLEHDVEPVASEQAALERLSERGPRPLLVETSAPPIPCDTDGGRDEIRLIDDTFNRQVFVADAGADGFLVLGLPWVPGFEVHVDGARAPAVRANALYPAVRLPRGRHVVAFRFVSRPFAVGALLAVCGLVFWVLWLTRSRRVGVTVATILAVCVLLGLWAAVLHGPSLGNEYNWSAEAVCRNPGR